MNSYLFTVLIAAVSFTSCKKDNTDPYNPTVKASLTVEFDNIAGGSNLLLNTGNYTNANAQQFTISKFKYYVSNFKLTSTSGTEFVVPQNESYFLVDESNLASQRPLLNIPEGEYKSISFMLGVDSLRNTMDVAQRTGVLDVSAAATEMYWSWNSGYIFLRLEGTSPAITGMGGVFQYHIGGFGGYATPTTNNLRTVTIDLTARGIAKVKTGRTANIHLFADALKIINGTVNMNFATTSMIHSPTAAIPLANNVTGMFTHDHTEN